VSAPNPPDDLQHPEVDLAIRHVKTVDVDRGIGAADHHHGPLDAHIDDITRTRLTESVPENTRLAYTVVRDQFISWCARVGRCHLPAHSATLTTYVSAMITEGAAPATISQHVGAIRTMHRVAGYPGQPDNSGALQLLRGYRRELAEDGVRERKATPLLRDDLRLVVSRLPLDTLAGRRDQLLLVLGFALMARRSELVALTLGDVRETAEGLNVAIRTSKTDKESRGVDVALPHGEHPDVDPVRLVRAWVNELAELHVTDGSLLRAVDRNGNLGGALRPSSVNTIVRRAVLVAGLPDAATYSAHSLRAGGLTSSLRKGVPLGVAAAHGRWSPKSPVVIQYARTADRWRDNAMRGVL
jgi:integrase